MAAVHKAVTTQAAQVDRAAEAMLQVQGELAQAARLLHQVKAQTAGAVYGLILITQLAAGAALVQWARLLTAQTAAE